MKGPLITCLAITPVFWCYWHFLLTDSQFLAAFAFLVSRSLLLSVSTLAAQLLPICFHYVCFSHLEHFHSSLSDRNSLKKPDFWTCSGLKLAFNPVDLTALNIEGLSWSPLSSEKQLRGYRLGVQNLLDAPWGMHNVMRVQNLYLGPTAKERWENCIPVHWQG